VRLSGGEHGGRVLSVASDVRPTESRVREALFAVWTPLLPNARFLDLFAGTGAVALEAVGRGALGALCIEADRRALAVLERNVRRLGEEGVVEIRRGTLPDALARLTGDGEAQTVGGAGTAAPVDRFDLVFADPPYRFADHAALLAAVAPLLAPDGEVAVEHSARRELPLEVPAPGTAAGRLVRVDVRRYGESSLSFYRHGPS
jgi:16S rRNA (guanine(966)-N(2))-methyltransferase RsmD